jgi:uncharacterized peroxidase-related enzyme
MPSFPNLGRNATVPDIFRMSPDASGNLMELHEVLMRGDSPLSPGERELIAAYVSALNECRYCRGVHTQTAVAFGFQENTISELLDDIESADIDEKMKPLLQFSRKLTLKPSSITDSDSDAVYQTGWDERALHHTIMVTCIFNFMNRLLEGHGVHGHEGIFKDRGMMLKEHGYRHTILNPKP